jgi:hypothetical protein
MFVDDFVELNFSDRNFLNLGPNPDTNLALHGVCPEALTIPPKTAKNRQTRSKYLICNELNKLMKNGVGLSYPLSYAREVIEVLLVFDRGLRGVINATSDA